MKQFSYLLTIIACSFALANCGRSGSLEMPVAEVLVTQPTGVETAAIPEPAKDETAVPPVAENDPEIVVDPIPENGLHTNPLPPDAGQISDPPIHPVDGFDGIGVVDGTVVLPPQDPPHPATPVGEAEWVRGQVSL